MSTEPTTRRVSPLRALLGVVATVALLGWLLSRVEPAQVVAVLGDLDPIWTSVGLCLYLALQGVRALRFRRLAPEATPRLLLSVHLVQALLLRVMPFRSGELGFAWLMRRHGGGSMSRNLVGVLLIRVLDLTTITMLFAVALITFGRPRAWLALVALAVAATLVPLALRPLLSLGARIVGRSTAGRARLAAPGRRLAAALEEASTLPGRAIATLHAITLAQWTLNFVLLWVMLAAMRVPASLAQTVLGGTGSVFGALVPIAGVGSFGPLEAGWTLGFAAVGMEETVAVTSAFGFSVVSFAYALVSAALGWGLLPARPAVRPEP